MNFCTCVHVMDYKSTVGVQALEIIHACFVSCISEQTRKEKARSTCHTCGSYGLGLHACLYCVYLGCFSSKHIHEHARILDHNLAIDLSHGTLYCFSCMDNVYDQDLEVIAKRFKSRCSRRLGIKVPYIAWEPDSIEVKLLEKNRKRRHIGQNSYIGLRGVLNLGKTCFINCVIQALIHTPVLRDYFLSDLHVCQFSTDPTQCMACEMANLFQEFYSGTITPLSPHHLLGLVWTHSKHLAGDLQQDAQEFLMAILDTLHCHCKGSNGLPSNNPNHCNCIIDQIFTGSYQSDIVCQQCKKVSMKIDPFRDISLGLVKLDNGHEPETLVDCLKRHTRIENLKDYYCNTCQCPQDSTKQLRITKLPVIACFHLKRFDNSRKITTHVSFPLYIDMTPFTSSYREDNCTVTNNDNSSITDNDNLYTLFAVVNHEGDSIETGHYKSYIRQHKDQWFQCDDDVITWAIENDVLNSQGYLLFYHKHILKYA